MSLFEFAENPKNKPLAEILRPENIEDIIGQEKTIGRQAKLGQMLRKGVLPSLIIWGPPGTGKTSFALTLARQFSAQFISLNATDAGAKQLREEGEKARQRKVESQQRTILFVDEIHRFNKGQQDVLLPFVERGDVILIGATTENPSYELNRALLSRVRVIIFENLSTNDLKKIIHKVEVYYQIKFDQLIEDEAIEYLMNFSDGDARRLLNACEIIYQYHIIRDDKSQKLGTSDIQELLQQSPLAYDRASEMHYDLISAFIKSIRGSDPDAGLYYLARMIEGGEDPIFIARRLVILASEDVGNADPRALTLAVSGLEAVELIGLPEAAISLAQVVTYLASAPKSNASYLGLHAAQAEVKNTKSLPVPLSLRSARTALAKELNYGEGYKYSHDFPKSWADQDFFPAGVKNKKYYQPKEIGFEKTIREFFKWLKT